MSKANNLTMKAKTELFLYQCLWVTNMMFRPTWRNMSGSFEEWSYRSGLLRQVQRLEADGWVESRIGPDGTERVIRLTEKGYLKALGGRMPEERWNRPWDGKWRMILFDLPEEKRAVRNVLRKQLRAAHFGGLQRSAWITPDPIDAIGESLKKVAADSGVMTFFEGATCGGETSEELVATAWNFAKINGAFTDHQSLLNTLPKEGSKQLRERLLDWAQEEKNSWSFCMTIDPLLPRSLCPNGYLGEITWKNRTATLHRAAVLANKSCDK